MLWSKLTEHWVSLQMKVEYDSLSILALALWSEIIHIHRIVFYISATLNISIGIISSRWLSPFILFLLFLYIFQCSLPRFLVLDGSFVVRCRLLCEGAELGIEGMENCGCC